MDADAEFEREIRNKTIGTAATPAEKAAFERFCQSKGIRPSQMLRLMLARVCPDDIEPGDVPTKHLRGFSMHLRLNEQEAKAIRAKAKTESTTGPGWVRKIVRTVLLKQPNFHPDEVNALRESNRELAYLGRNVNQIAHQLNISLNASDQMTAQRLEILVRMIDAHKEKVYGIINASWGRYGGDGDE